MALFAYLVGSLRGFVRRHSDDLGGDLVEMGGEGTAQFLKLWPKRHLDEAGRGTDNDGLTVQPRVEEWLDAVSTAKGDKKLTGPGIRHRAIESFGTFLLAGVVEFDPASLRLSATGRRLGD